MTVVNILHIYMHKCTQHCDYKQEICKLIYCQLNSTISYFLCCREITGSFARWPNTDWLPAQHWSVWYVNSVKYEFRCKICYTTCTVILHIQSFLLRATYCQNTDLHPPSPFSPQNIPHSFSAASLFLWPPSLSHSFVPFEIVWTTQMYQASVLWSSLPISLCHSHSTSVFRSAPKTHLFPSQ